MPTHRKPDRSGVVAWPEPKPLPNGLAPVEPFSSDFLPDAFAPWVEDIANRLQCPPDYVAVAALTHSARLLVDVSPSSRRHKTDWVEIPNLWGCFIGRPGMLKSPAMMEALKPIHHLEAEAAKAHTKALVDHQAALAEFKLHKSVKESILKEELKKKIAEKVVSLGGVSSLKDMIKDAQKEDPLGLGARPEEPKPVRYRTNDSSYEATWCIADRKSDRAPSRTRRTRFPAQAPRPRGAMRRARVLPDRLVGHAALHFRPHHSRSHSYRGGLHRGARAIPNQPGLPSTFIARIAAAPAAMGSFNALIFWSGPMRLPIGKTSTSIQIVRRAKKPGRFIERLGQIDESAALKLGAEKGPYDKVPALRFDEGAQEDFRSWRTDLERRLHSGDLSPALEGHLAKYRKLVPTLALMNHLADRGEGLISHRSLLKALATAYYLESHARRVYGSGHRGRVGGRQGDPEAHPKRGPH